jgi:uncharacterized protein YgfB (UPF0149 family)
MEQGACGKMVDAMRYTVEQEALDDLEDIKALRAAEEAERDESTISLAEVRKELGI